MLTNRNAVLIQLGLTKIALDILQEKRRNYSGSVDPFGNFRLSSSLGVLPERGVLIRMSDKLSRVGQMADRVPAFDGNPEHPVVDGLRDILNYDGIVAGLFAEKDPALADYLATKGQLLIGHGLEGYVPDGSTH